MRMQKIVLVAAALTALGAPGWVMGQIVITSQQYVAEGPANWSNSSAIPVSDSDLINGLLPTANNYVGTFEAAGGTPAPMTNGSTGAGPDEPTNNSNSL